MYGNLFSTATIPQFESGQDAARTFVVLDFAKRETGPMKEECYGCVCSSRLLTSTLDAHSEVMVSSIATRCGGKVLVERKSHMSIDIIGCVVYCETQQDWARALHGDECNVKGMAVA